MSDRRAVVIAPDKFKGSLTADEVAQALADGMGDGREVRLCPLADGGEGSVNVALRAGFLPKPVTVHGPTGQRMTVTIALQAGTAMIEVAAICGLHTMPGVLAPLTATSYGVGEAIRQALDLGARRVILAVGGSATVDGGAGMLAALGARLLDSADRPIGPGGKPLLALSTVDATGLDPRLRDIDLVLACDVDNPLTDAATVYGPQKGAGPADIALLRQALSTLAHATEPAHAARPGAGAAGGIGFAAYLLQAHHREGAQFFLELSALDNALADAGLVITGEGSLDRQTLSGKLPLAVARRAEAAGVPAVAVAGRCGLDTAQTRAAGFTAVYTLADRDRRSETDPRLSRRLLVRIGAELAEQFLDQLDDTMSVPLPNSFSYRTIDADGVRINCAVGGEGPPILLLHGYPQTHLIWHHIAPTLAADHTVVLTDLRGYGDSDKPRPTPGDSEYAKRAMAHDQLLTMRALGYDRFGVAGHDRGGRVGHRLALDAPDAVSALAVLDIVPTRYAFSHADKAFGLGYYHWFFLAAGNGIPERLIGADPEFWITARMSARHHGGTPFDPAALAQYIRCFADPAAIAASCADYRAAAAIDLEHDEADQHRQITCPMLALWGEHSFVGRTYDVISAWREYASDVHGKSLPCDHYLPEEQPGPVATSLHEFFTRRGASEERLCP